MGDVPRSGSAWNCVDCRDRPRLHGLVVASHLKTVTAMKTETLPDSDPTPFPELAFYTIVYPKLTNSKRGEM